MPKANLTRKLKKLRLLLFDVDGVMTDGRLIYGDDGTEYKTFDAQDGYGIARALERGLKVGIITGRVSSVVDRRARELGVTDVYQNSFNKVSPFEEMKRKYGLKDEEVAYMGDDAFDLPLLEKVGVGIAPGNAVEEVKRRVDIVTKARGGRGAIREAIDLILRSQGRL
jgi:3-deoxy-D-manno-octulosonate 8-phosphate phosphatase (KDO 8-P phosphatase)